MLEMADAYATLANGGVHIPPTILDRVVFSDGSTVNIGDPPHHRVFTDGEAYAATKVLETVIQAGTGTAANYGCPAAGKTGTAENLDNAWFVGYNPLISTAVWVGYPQGNIPMGPNGFGGTLAAPIWNQYMQAASNGYCGDFPLPTDPWSGVPFSGPHSVAAPVKNNNGNRSGSGSNNTGRGGPGSQLGNPTLFAQPTQPQGGPPHAGGNGGNGGNGKPSGGGAPGGHGGGGHKNH
jgi:penicillin-binding protein 1A